MSNLGGKVFPSYITRSESSPKGYMKSTAESKNKPRNRNMDEEDQEKKRSPLKSPRLCEEVENYSPNNLHLKMEIKREYYPPKYDDPAQAQPIENKTYFQTLPQDEFGDSYQHRPRPPSGSSSSEKLRKERSVTPKSSDKNEKYREKTEFGKEHKLCNMKLSIKEREINRLKGIIDHLSKPLEAKVFTYEIEKSKRFDDIRRQVKILEVELFKAKSNLERVGETHVKHLQSELDAKTEEVNKLTRQQIRAESLRLELKNLQREEANVEQQDNEFTRALQAKGIEIESLVKHRERSEEQIRNLNYEIADIQKSKRHTVNESLQQLLTENSSLKSTLEHRNLEIENLSKECEKQRRTREKGEHEMTELEQVVQKKKNEMMELNTMLEEFSKKCSALDRDKEEAHANISALTDALNEKKRDVESLTNQLERAEEKVSILSQDIKDIQASKRQIAEEKLQSLQTENSSLKSALSKATNEIEDLLNERTNLQKYKTDAEHKTSTLMNALKEKKTEIEALRDQLARIDDLWNKCTNLQKYKSDTELEIRTLLNAIEEKETEIKTLHKRLERSEKSVSILSKDIKDIQGSKRQAADEKVQGLKTENASLKLELVEATTEIDALRNKCTNLQKYKTDTEHTINTMLNAAKEKENESESLNKQLARKNNELSKDVSYLKKDKENAENQRNRLSKALDEKEKEIEAMRNDITRSEEKVSELSKKITDIKVSKRQTADEKLQDFQAENASLRSALSKSTIQIEELSYKCTNLQKYRTDTEHKLSKLLNAEEEKENEIKSLNADLARIKDMSLENKDPEMDLENAEHKTDKLSKTVQDKEEKLETLVELKEKADDNVTSTGIL